MPVPIRIIINQVELNGELFDTACAREISAILPFETAPEDWGDEFYFYIPVSAGLDDTATSQVKVGDIGYWPPGNALAIFFGPTPMSKGPDPVPASAVNLVGKIIGDAAILKTVIGAEKIRIERLPGGVE
ncbi:hypothetical protein SAMN04489760_103204 [Syntrophus gentianae]|uniref:Cyclophilin TM1367-like domain-containing protein n=1 Tax=Syntrophus gentianae TaxID=43775 RepID=A0A1H7VF59_9BACT|nr:cyclophilin-like fold protein [Syntrophus gentianae]SEM07488.1 hypothetical protein SAMN04489760_103204 [Syntrophus gentianae]